MEKLKVGQSFGAFLFRKRTFCCDPSIEEYANTPEKRMLWIRDIAAKDVKPLGCLTIKSVK